ncbi:unnamed protein product [Linum trigynum]|uniref:Retrovirus-related Pol polyprotein from transposon TNT 1-94-like beta-barrel domain-containing protein n=1 Tax=Linum trigynum TaxID=586398 RepID=A0AAV2D6P5_9ROSI
MRFWWGAIIAKLPPSWNNYRKKLLHTSEEFTLEQIQKHLRIEEETRIRDKDLNSEAPLSSKVNVVESKKGKKRKAMNNSNNQTNNQKNKKKKSSPMSTKNCFNCGQLGQIVRFCPTPKKNQNEGAASANVIEKVDPSAIVAMICDLHVSMIQELHMAGVMTSADWWYDLGATAHICNKRAMFKDYTESTKGHEVLLGDHRTIKVLGSGTGDLFFTSGKSCSHQCPSRS